MGAEPEQSEHVALRSSLSSPVGKALLQGAFPSPGGWCGGLGPEKSPNMISHLQGLGLRI